MDAAETAAACELAAQVVAETTTMVEGVHRSILQRVRRALPGPDVTMDAVELPTRGVYAVVRASALGIGHAAATAAGVAVSQQSPSAAGSPRGAAWLAGITAALGDQIDSDPRLQALSPQLSFYDDGKPVAPGELPLPGAAAAVFLHGLAGTELTWSRWYREALAEQDVASLFVRYNSGRSIHENGRDLAALLSQLCAAHPGLQRLILVGHSMGGLIACSAVSQGAEEPWVALTTDIVTLGTPHRGAALEKVAAIALAGLAVVPESRPIAEFGNRRAAGIKDLRHGALLAEHWDGKHPDSVLWDSVLRSEPVHAPKPPHIRLHAVVASLGERGSLLGAVLGDGLVRSGSASARFADDGEAHLVRLHGTGHMSLLRHPEVAELLTAVAVRGAA
jgi:pimeloyl-ACP methyl ester carboxylesterase